MAQSKRVLFISGEVTPFAQTSSVASLVRSLPEQLQEAGDFEARVMMPCYGNIDEREHSLHEVIRLSGTDVPMGDRNETLTVKVASVPDVRLQVYFMDHDTYFENGGMASDGSASFEALARRALFFNRATLETIQKLRWGPDVVHAFGWMGGLIPLLLSTDYGREDLYSKTKAVFTPDDKDPGTPLTSDLADTLGISLNGTGPATFSDTGTHHADASITPPDAPPVDGAVQFDPDSAQHGEQLADLYEQMLNEVPA